MIGQRIRCPCCDSIFEIEVTRIDYTQGKIILDKINSLTSQSEGTKVLSQSSDKSCPNNDDEAENYGSNKIHL
ncbi:hypothetical protein HY498_05090 [Candidatus Woesearchaeota archaeon]|nr:hypothetical protein [Candidatus Woesearchaeota archaeon]